LKIITFTENLALHFKRSSGILSVVFEPYRPYVLADAQFNKIFADEKRRKIIFKCSVLTPRLPGFNIKSASKSDPVLVYVGSGGFGDQIMAWPCARVLAKMGFNVHILTDPGNDVCWWGFPWVKSISSLPIQLEQLKLYKQYAISESLCNHDEHHDQRHPVDTLLHHWGIDPDSISALDKVVPPAFFGPEITRAKAFHPDKKLAFYQLAASNSVRSLGVDESAFVLKALADAFPDWHWYALHDGFVNESYKNAVTSMGLANVEVAFFTALRDLWCLVNRAEVCVGPDSMLLHVAGSLGKPSVGLWGPTSPNNRVLYYQNHQVLTGTQCQYAPCHHTGDGFPPYCPTSSIPRTACECFNSITPERVIQAVLLATEKREVCLHSSNQRPT
jgi:hypothetical protein